MVLNLGRVESFLQTHERKPLSLPTCPLQHRWTARQATHSQNKTFIRGPKLLPTSRLLAKPLQCQASPVPWGSMGEASCTQSISHAAPSRGVTHLEAVSLWCPAKACAWVLARSTSVPRHPAVSEIYPNPSARIRSLASHLLPGSLPASLTTAAVPCLSVCLLLVPSLYCSPGSPELYCSCCFLLLAHPG